MLSRIGDRIARSSFWTVVACWAECGRGGPRLGAVRSRWTQPTRSRELIGHVVPWLAGGGGSIMSRWAFRTRRADVLCVGGRPRRAPVAGQASGSYKQSITNIFELNGNTYLGSSFHGPGTSNLLGMASSRRAMWHPLMRGMFRLGTLSACGNRGGSTSLRGTRADWL